MGTKSTGRVVTVIDAGVFVEVKKSFNGMIPEPLVDRRNLGARRGRSGHQDHRRAKCERLGQQSRQYSVGGTYPGRVVTAKDAYLVVELEPRFPCIAPKDSFPAHAAAASLDHRDTEAHLVVKTMDKTHHRVELGPAEVHSKAE